MQFIRSTCNNLCHRISNKSTPRRVENCLRPISKWSARSLLTLLSFQMMRKTIVFWRLIHMKDSSGQTVTSTLSQDLINKPKKPLTKRKMLGQKRIWLPNKSLAWQMRICNRIMRRVAKRRPNNSNRWSRVASRDPHFRAVFTFIKNSCNKHVFSHFNQTTSRRISPVRLNFPKQS